jgi:hypothetical protein
VAVPEAAQQRPHKVVGAAAVGVVAAGEARNSRPQDLRQGSLMESPI